MGGPEMAPQTPQTLVAPRETRGAPRSLRPLLAGGEGFGVGLRPLEPFLQLMLRLLHELDRLGAVAVVMMDRLLELFLRPLQITAGGDHVGMAPRPLPWLALRRRSRRGGRRRLRSDRGREQNSAQRQSRHPKLSSHAKPSC